MKFAVIKDGLIFNTAEADEEFGTAQGWVQFPEYVDGKPVQIGWFYDGVNFTAPPEPEPQQAE